MRNKKILTLLLIGLMFINAGIPDDAEINITAQRADQSNCNFRHITTVFVDIQRL